ncbi:MAG: AraC family transcriptional regulator [Halioglobus sp.]|nr:AraC family transcriptional regulator [Halioglobus sp.]
MDPQFEAVELEGDSVIKTFPVRCALLQENHGWHYHPECELTFVAKGQGTRFIGDSVQHYEPGDIVLAGPDLPHCWINDDRDNSDPDRNNLLVLQFRPDCLGSDFLNSPDALALQNLFDRAKRGLKFSGNSTGEVASAMARLQEQSGLSRLTTFLKLLDMLTQCTEVEALTSELYYSDKTEFHGGRIGNVIDYVKANLSKDIKQTEAANLVAMTPQGFSRFFRATTGRTFVSFVNVMRIMEACRLLVNTDYDIIDIAFECGYANLSNFNRRFSELKQTTPRDYRQQHNKRD